MPCINQCFTNLRTYELFIIRLKETDSSITTHQRSQFGRISVFHTRNAWHNCSSCRRCCSWRCFRTFASFRSTNYQSSTFSFPFILTAPENMWSIHRNCCNLMIVINNSRIITHQSRSVMLSPRGQSRGQNFGLGLEALVLASTSRFWPRPGLDLVVLLWNRAFFVLIFPAKILNHMFLIIIWYFFIIIFGLGALASASRFLPRLTSLVEMESHQSWELASNQQCTSIPTTLCPPKNMWLYFLQ